MNIEHCKMIKGISNSGKLENVALETIESKYISISWFIPDEFINNITNFNEVFTNCRTLSSLDLGFNVNNLENNITNII